MSRGRTIVACLCVALLLAAFTEGMSGAEPGSATAVVRTDAPPPPPLPALKSPIKFFRDLLTMSPAEREQQLAARPPQSRQVILDKLQEYEGLPADERELRLRTTELSWYLKQLLTLAAPQRATLLTNVSPMDRELVEARLTYWDKIPSEQQQRLIESEAALKYLSQMRRGGGDSTGASSHDMAGALDRLRRLGPGEREKVMEQFKRLFELDDNERSKVLDRRPGPERDQLERALIQLKQIPVEKQPAYVDAVNRFTMMSRDEQAQFLKSAERWKRLSAEERAAWRALFTQSPPLPELPPLPPNSDPRSPPPLPPGASTSSPPFQATNTPTRPAPGA